MMIAGCLSQEALQSEKLPRNSLLFTIELGMYEVIFSGFRLSAEGLFGILDGRRVIEHGFFGHLELSVLIPITVNAVGGIGIGYIMKYASILHKSYAMMFGILLSGIFRSMLYSRPMSNAMMIAVPMVMLSMLLDTPSKIKKKKL